MVSNYDIDEATVHAYVDGELDAGLRQTVLQAIYNNPRLREQISQLRMVKDLMKAGFPLRQARQPLRLRGPSRGRRWLGTALAASLATVVMGLGGGLLGYWCAGISPNVSALQAHPERVVLHLDNSDPGRFRSVLDYAENFLRQHTERGTQVEVVANANGIDLLRRGVSPYETRMRAMMQQYPNLHFVACANSIRQLRETGTEVLIMTDVHSGSTALDHIVSRLRDGWSYHKIDDFSSI